MEHGQFCTVCTTVHSDDDPTHNNSRLHRFNFLLFQWNNYRKALVKNRHGVEVTVAPKPLNGYLYNYSEPKKGKHCLKITPHSLSLHQNTLEFCCTLKNISKNDVTLTSAQLLHPYRLYSLYDLQGNLENGRFPQLQPKAEYVVMVKYSFENTVIGSYKIPVFFNFQTTGQKADTFTIARAIVVSVEEEIITEEVTEKSPFTNNDWPPNIELIQPKKTMHQMNNYPIPPEIYVLFKYGLQQYQGMGADGYSRLREIREQMRPGYVTENNYRHYWHNVLWLEEMGQTLMLKRYNMENVKMELIGGEILELVVPGLAEKRPSVILGDMIDIRIHDDHRAYRGVIQRVNNKTVEIAYVHKELLGYVEQNPDIELDVRFVLGRLPLERQHQAIDQTVANQLVPILFPKYEMVHHQVPQTLHVRDSEFNDSTIVNNPEQKTAVLKILNSSSNGVPYIVFGPPGTGKTITIVEAILQIMRKTKNKILVCAPANAACDMLTEKLIPKCRPNELIRIVSETVDRGNIKRDILPYTNLKNNDYEKILAEDLGEYRIVVTTLILIGRYTRKYHPDYVFVDEAAQACEPEVDCALGMIDCGKQIVLAGDPKQLGPIVSSRPAIEYGLEKSLLERLMDLPLYRSRNPNFITMLKQNYRSHSMIVRLPNELFYENQLQAMSARSENDPLAKVFVFEKIQGNYRMGGKKGRKKKSQCGKAIEFCSILSKESKEGHSPSFFNVKEMQAVLKYVEALTRLDFDEEDKVLPEQIGVVTPYIRQVHKIKEHLRRHDFEGVEVGTTEAFQGREKRVIIISTVRAQHDLLLHDKKYKLGFVNNAKRFNVAITRAMSKLIVIGCAQVLGTDANWLAYIDLCENEEVFCGAPYQRRTRDVIENITRRMDMVHMHDSQYNHR